MKRIIICICFLVCLQPPQKAAGPTPPQIPVWKDMPAEEFIVAARIGNLSKMKQLYAQDPSIINQWDANRNTALIEAIKSDQRDVVIWLIEKKANIEHKDKTGKTAMDYADGKPVILGDLLQAQGIMPPPLPAAAGAGVRRPPSPKKSRPVSPKKALPTETPKVSAQPQPKKAAAAAVKATESPEQERKRIIAEMRASGFWPEYIKDDHPRAHAQAVLIAAIKSNNLPYVQYALEIMKADPSNFDFRRDGRSVVFDAIETGNAGILNYLLSRKDVQALLGRKDKHRVSPLSYAAYKGNKQLVEIFLTYAEEIITNQGALEHARDEARKKGNNEIADLIDAKIKELSATELTPLELVIKEEPAFTAAQAKKLLDARTFNDFPQDEVHLLRYGIEHKSLPIVRYVFETLKPPIDQLITRFPKETSLAYAVRKKSSLEIIKYLLDRGANINFRVVGDNFKDETPLDIAIKDNNLDLVRLFLGYSHRLNEQTIRDAIKLATQYKLYPIKNTFEKVAQRRGIHLEPTRAGVASAAAEVKREQVGAGVPEQEIKGAAAKPAPELPAPLPQPQPTPKPSPLPKVEREQKAAGSISPRLFTPLEELRRTEQRAGAGAPKPELPATPSPTEPVTPKSGLVIPPFSDAEAQKVMNEKKGNYKEKLFYLLEHGISRRNLAQIHYALEKMKLKGYKAHILSSGHPILNYATLFNNSLETIRYLLDQGFLLSQDKESRTPLHNTLGANDLFEFLLNQPQERWDRNVNYKAVLQELKIKAENFYDDGKTSKMINKRMKELGS